MHPIDFEVKRKGQCAWSFVNGFRTITDCNRPMIMTLHTLTPHESLMRPIDFEVKVMAHGYL